MNEINGFVGQYRFLSNFWFASITISGLTFPTNEHAYQAAKSEHPEDWRAIRNCITPGLAKCMGKTITIRPDWDNIKLDVMREITAAKYDQHWELKAKLMLTKGMKLIETNTWGDTFWGVSRGVGHNFLGRILMEYRDR